MLPAATAVMKELGHNIYYSYIGIVSNLEIEKLRVHIPRDNLAPPHSTLQLQQRFSSLRKFSI